MHLDSQFIPNMPFIKSIISLLFLWVNLKVTLSQVYLSADDTPDAYRTINNVLGGNAVEVPDCGHQSFGRHITQGWDSSLGWYAFTFHAHVNEDDDRCQNQQRQRTEIKVYGPSRDYLKGRRGDSVSYSWYFKLDRGFQPSNSHSAIHQIKAGDGNNAGRPLVVIGARKGRNGNPNYLELEHVDSNSRQTILRTVNLSNFLGQWIRVVEELTYEPRGRYKLSLTRYSDSRSLLEYSGTLDLWRDGSTFIRPKWGLYRGLSDKRSLRDERVGFAEFCFAKGSDYCG